MRTIVEQRFCKHCGYPISKGSKNGVCINCRYKDGKQFSEGKKCSECGRPLVNWNKNGTCYICNGKSENPQDGNVRYTGVIGRCWKCSRHFPLRSDQYKCYEEIGMHWCPECERTDDYKDFSYIDKINQSMVALKRNSRVNWFGD